MSDRKYRTPGYQDRDDSRNEAKPTPRPSRDNTYGPKPLQMAPTRMVSRCSECGVVLAATVGVEANCPQCSTALHSCKQCTHFDPGCRFDCQLNISGYSKKTINNDCASFSLRSRVERETSAAETRADDARRAFENLFKK